MTPSNSPEGLSDENLRVLQRHYGDPLDWVNTSTVFEIHGTERFNRLLNAAREEGRAEEPQFSDVELEDYAGLAQTQGLSSPPVAVSGDETLAACPFCGGCAIPFFSELTRRKTLARCTACGAETQLAAWNRRPSPVPVAGDGGLETIAEIVWNWFHVRHGGPFYPGAKPSDSAAMERTFGCAGEIYAALSHNTRAAVEGDDAAALEGYRAATHYIGADSWDGCPDCIAILKLACGADLNREMSQDEIAHALRRLRQIGGVPHPAALSPAPDVGVEDWPNISEALALDISRGDDTDVNEWDDCLVMADHLLALGWSRAPALPQVTREDVARELADQRGIHFDKCTDAIRGWLLRNADEILRLFSPPEKGLGFMTEIVYPGGCAPPIIVGRPKIQHLEARQDGIVTPSGWREMPQADAILAMIDALRKEEGHSVIIHCDNPDFFGANNAVEIIADWTEWKERRFEGETLLAALTAAVEAMPK